MWTCQSNTSMSNLMWLYVFSSFLFFFKSVSVNLGGFASCLSRARGILRDFLCRFFLHDFISIVWKQNDIFVTKIKRNKNNHGLIIHINCYNIRKLISLSACNNQRHTELVQSSNLLSYILNNDKPLFNTVKSNQIIPSDVISFLLV